MGSLSPFCGRRNRLRLCMVRRLLEVIFETICVSGRLFGLDLDVLTLSPYQTGPTLGARPGQQSTLFFPMELALQQHYCCIAKEIQSIMVHHPNVAYCRYPHMSSAEPATSVFVSTSRDHPLHLWDAFTGSLRATYRAYDHLDEVVAANSVCFNTTGDKIFAGKITSVPALDTV